jgi:hypothetical protein
VSDPANSDKVVAGVSLALHEAGYTPAAVKDYWHSQPQGYAGFNTNWLTPDGQVFELQFHTAESLYVKEMVSHPLYDALKGLSPADPKFAEINTRINTSWAAVRQNPPSAFGAVVSMQLLNVYGRPLP